MSDRISKLKCIILWAIVVIIAVSVFLCSSTNEQVYNTVSAGHYYFDAESPYSLDDSLSGEWEFYPDVLLYSDPQEDLPEPEMVTVPDRWLANSSHTVPSSGNASYRIVLDNYSPAAGRSNIVISLLGFLQDYDVYVNGTLMDVRIPSPTGYPVYAIDETGDVEIVIELHNSTTGLTSTPGLWAIGIHISNIDTTRNVLFIIISLFFILFVMFLVFSFSKENSRLRPLTVLGLILIALFVFELIWATGYLSSVNTVIGNDLLKLICIALRLFAIGWCVIISRRMYPEVFSMVHSCICGILLSVSLVISILAVYVWHWYNGWIAVYVLTGAAVLLYLVYASYGLRRLMSDCFEISLTALIVSGPVAVTFAYDWYPDQKNWLFALPAAIVFTIVICFMNYYRCQREALNQTKRLLELEKYASRTQTAMLSSQIQPHFLYNTLLTIQELCRFDPAEASRVIVRFSDYLRHNIDFMNYSELIPFEKEEKHIDNYIYIQEARFEDKLKFSSDIKTRDFMIPPLTVQPLIENAIKYGVRSRIEGGFVSLNVYEDHSGIHITIQNSGDGFNTENIRDDHSIGNIRTRLKMLSNAILTIQSHEKQEGTLVEIFIPKKNIIKVTDIPDTEQ